MKIAIIGGGIAGLGAAWLLSKQHDVSLFEKNDYIGGHSNTATVSYPTKTSNKIINVDTGFIVYNFKTYHNLKPLFEELDVQIEKSNMSFGISDQLADFEYASSGFFKQIPNFLSKKAFFKMFADIVRFNKAAHKLINSTAEPTLGEFVDNLQMSDAFKKYYLLPMGAAIWSCPMNVIEKYPAQAFLRFFANHGLLQITNHPQWYTVSGGSKQYVKKIIEPFKEQAYTNCAIKNVSRQADAVIITDQYGTQHKFDQIVIASHADQTLAMIENPTKKEQDILGSFKYSKNTAILHRDIAQMPKRRSAWASWNYLSGKAEELSLTYWMNNLQNIPKNMPLFVTLNPFQQIAQEKIFATYEYEHPIFDQAAIEAQRALPQIQGKNKIWFAGAYWRYGFHEDGLLSALNIANQFGIKAPWQKNGS